MSPVQLLIFMDSFSIAAIFFGGGGAKTAAMGDWVIPNYETGIELVCGPREGLTKQYREIFGG